MTEHKFRFGVVAAPWSGVEQWRQTARKAELLGYSTLLMPDGLQLPSVSSSLAVAAEATESIRLGTFVMASVLRPPRMLAYEANSLSMLTEGRFELGIGTGNPAVIEQASQQLGYPERGGGERLAMVRESIEALRELDGERHTPVLMAAGGPKARELAAAKADSVTIAAPALTSRAEFGAMVEHLREAAGARADALELAANLFVIGDEVPEELRGFIGVDGKQLAQHDSMAQLRGGTQQMADELRRRRDEYGITYVSVNSAFLEELAPVVELLHGS